MNSKNIHIYKKYVLKIKKKGAKKPYKKEKKHLRIAEV